MEHVSDSEIGAEIESEGVERVGNARQTLGLSRVRRCVGKAQL